MDGSAGAEEVLPIFYIGQHETDRKHDVSDHIIRQAQDAGYDMISAPITTSTFQSNILSLLSSLPSDSNARKLIPAPLVPPFTPKDTSLTPGDGISQLLALTSSWIDLASPDPIIADISKQVLNAEVAYASFCGVQNIVVKGPTLDNGHAHGDGVARFARALSEASSLGNYVQMHVLLPIWNVPDGEQGPEIGDLWRFAHPDYLQKSNNSARPDGFSTWEAWNTIRSICKYNSRIAVALSLPRQLPPMPVQSRWYSENPRLLYLHQSSFVQNNHGQPVLPQAHQALIVRYARLRTPPWLLLGDVGPIPNFDDSQTLSNGANSVPIRDQTASMPTPAESTNLVKAQHTQKRMKDDQARHLSYVRYLQRHQPPKSIIERFGAGYQDFLQSPLQPLTDNLESLTYEVFEKDPIKYDWYERAVAQALKEWSAQGKSTSAASAAVVVAVAGAGRGPLVTRVLRASESTGIAVEAWAVEKNPNAFVLLQRHNIDDWKGKVTVVKSDMRSWKGPLRADGTHGHVDILVSELLGSFADNELSPECLDGVQHVLNPTHGISIPTSYTAHLTPIAAPRIHADILGRVTSGDPNAFETPWVVMLHSTDYLSTLPVEAAAPRQPDTQSSKADRKAHLVNTTLTVANVQTAWEFFHPLPASILQHANLRRGGGLSGGGGGLSGGGGGSTGGDGANEHNTRFTKLTFPIQHRGICHGLAGYFETVLYRNQSTSVELSTNPVTMEAKSKDMISWFPIFFPLKQGLWCAGNGEIDVSMWRMTDDRSVWYEWVVEAFLVVGGERVRTGGSELHSSRKQACLM